MHWLVLVALAAVVGVLIYTLVRLGRNDFTLLADRMAKRTRESFAVLKPCPLCGSMLRKGETVHSVVFSGGAQKRRDESQDYLAHLFGCPYCYPSNREHPRTCPVCSKTIPADGYVVARMFERPERKHVHVLGCTECRTPKPR